MRLLIFPVPAVFFPYKKRQLIFVDSLLFIIIILPAKPDFLPVLRNRLIPQNFPIFIFRIKIKYKDSRRIQIIIYQAKYPA